MVRDLHKSHVVHRNVLYSLVVLLVIIQIGSFVVISGQVSKLNTKIGEEVGDAKSEVREEFNILLRQYNDAYQGEFTKIEGTLSAQGESLTKQINLLKSSQSDFSGVINDALKGVVSVGTDKSAGTGFIVTSDGYVVTNNHVVEGANKIQVLTYDKKILDAVLIGVNVGEDIALLKISGSFTELELADSDSLQVGNKVIAIGNPLGLSFTVTEGIVSAVDRAGPNGKEQYIQTDVSLNPGNSGGPLISTAGEVVGINNFKIGDSEGLGFALESNAIRENVNSIAGQAIV